MFFALLIFALANASVKLTLTVQKTFWSESQPNLEAEICLFNEGSTPFRFVKSGTPFADVVSGFNIIARSKTGVIAEHIVSSSDENTFVGESVISGQRLCKVRNLNNLLVFQESGTYDVVIESSFYPCSETGCDEASVMALSSISPTDLTSNMVTIDVDADTTVETQEITTESNIIITETVAATAGCVWRSFTGYMVAVSAGSTQTVNGDSSSDYRTCKTACENKSNCHGFLVLSNNRCRIFDTTSIIISGSSKVYACRTAWKTENLWKTTNPNGKNIETWFQGCNAQKQQQIKDGYNSFKKLCDHLPSFLSTGMDYYKDQFELYFDNKDEGSNDRQLFNQRVQTRVEQVQRICDASNFGFSCVECGGSVLAYVYKGDQTHTIHLCDFEFRRRNTLMPGGIATSFADTIFHEFSHFSDLANTDDSPSYSHSYALQLAKEDPARAMQIASNFDKWAVYTEKKGQPAADECSAGKVKVTASSVASGFDLFVSENLKEGRSANVNCPSPLKGNVEVTCVNKKLQVKSFNCKIGGNGYSIVYEGFECIRGHRLFETKEDCLKGFKEATSINIGSVRPNSANYLNIRPPACHYKGSTLWFNSNKNSKASASFGDYMICTQAATGPTCGNGVCETGEVDQFCFKDCKREFAEKICVAAKQSNLCGEKCPALSSKFPDLYAAGLCGGVFDNKDTYSDFCQSKGIACVAPTLKPTFSPVEPTSIPQPVCGNGVCETGEVDRFCFADCELEFAKKICNAAKREQICDEKCPALANKFPDLYSAGLCGQIFEDKDSYSVFCEAKGLSCPSKSTGSDRFVPPKDCVCRPVIMMDGTKVEGKCFEDPTTANQVCYVSPASNCVASFITEGHLVNCIDRETKITVGSRKTTADDYKIISSGLCNDGYEIIDTLAECTQAFPLVSGFEKKPSTQSTNFRNKRAAGCHHRMVGGRFRLWFNPNLSSQATARAEDYTICRKAKAQPKKQIVCVNKHSNCANWKPYCETNVAFMSENCAKTCGLC